MGAQQNLVGWDGKTHIDGVRNMGYGGNVNRLVQLPGLAALDMGNGRLEPITPPTAVLPWPCSHKKMTRSAAMAQWSSVEAAVGSLRQPATDGYPVSAARRQRRRRNLERSAGRAFHAGRGRQPYGVVCAGLALPQPLRYLVPRRRTLCHGHQGSQEPILAGQSVRQLVQRRAGSRHLRARPL